MGYLWDTPEAADVLERATAPVTRQELDLVRRQLERGLNAPWASSMGRLFDAAAAVLGVRLVSRFEGQAAMELEALAGGRAGTVLPFGILRRPDGVCELDPATILVSLAGRKERGDDVPTLAASFHDTVVHATAELVRHVAADTRCTTIALGGGCFQNARLLSGLERRLERDGYTVLRPRRLGPNDGAVSFGQAAVGAAILAGLPTAVTVDGG
jgi:hydrogenase maturation protein HypF